ncbi:MULTISPECIES: glycosyltransferase [unclassified Thiocapsa]|uniref:glycosyltransferase n=1 Tax=unclassified Thiocapsa TaxID=2641286 RepID=UPI0035AFB13A
MIAVVIPVFNEGSALVANFKVIHRCLCQVTRYRFHVLIVDDGSCDDTPAHIRSIIEAYPDVSLVRLTRNFGKEAAIQAGLACFVS